MFRPVAVGCLHSIRGRKQEKLEETDGVLTMGQWEKRRFPPRYMHIFGLTFTSGLESQGDFDSDNCKKVKSASGLESQGDFDDCRLSNMSQRL